ncbi:hypothetical protein [Nocardia fluminea]|uniref:Uncharacterized protein n=1 Tax=Nocardia fluminea TaxID=134984 RepID=A0A2N3V6R6_9NOCA|nr:hypothetical protein [Nocardia fluminea]PKV77307.1 hypothetical protein ATK86_1637 [Nocardia fluminea]
MKRGLITESHVVIYCDTCGDVLTDADGESICFDSTNQAVSFLGVKLGGWTYDGDRITCDACAATAECETNGHRWPPTWQQAIWPASAAEAACNTCGITKSELTQEN